MHLSELKLWNFRKYGDRSKEINLDKPSVIVNFTDGLNVLVGENDSGKSTIVDAIRYTLGTQSREWLRLNECDFFSDENGRAEELLIECVFKGFTPKEAAPFLEWLSFEKQENEQLDYYTLNVRLKAVRKGSRIIQDFRAGSDVEGAIIDGEIRDLLRVTYLKPLRDADAELSPGRRSRFAQILSAHKLFEQKNSGDNAIHTLEEIIKRANVEIENYFSVENSGEGKEIMQSLTRFLTSFFPSDDQTRSSIQISGGTLSEILRRLSLSFGENSEGLGSLNLLYIAAELLLLQAESYFGLRLGIIEELEAHLHPQAQLRLVHFLEEEAETGQFILTSHSTTLGASIDLENLIVCRGDKTFSMGAKYTKLLPKNYSFLQRFLDATKANLFFARGVILVEGDAENLLIPTIAKIIEKPLHQYGVSIVNVRGTAFLHYANVFMRENGVKMGIKVSIITDMDVKPEEWEGVTGEKITNDEIVEKKKEKRENLKKLYSGDVISFISPNFTFEYEILLSGLRKQFYYSILWAEKIQNSSSGVPRSEKRSEVEAQVENDFEVWMKEFEDLPRKKEIIAAKIYKEKMLDRNISKAITAQVFAQRLLEMEDETPGAVKEILENELSLRYLIEAIYHATE